MSDAASRFPAGHFLSWVAGRRYPVLVAVITLAGMMLRLHGSGTLPLDFDEGATSYFAHLPLADLWGTPAWLETNPPLFYTLSHIAAMLLGDGEGALRLLPVVAGSLCVPAAAMIARGLAGEEAGLAAALLVATSAVNLESSQDARTYSLLALAALVALAATFWLLSAYRDPGQASPAWAHGRPARAGAWSIYVLACVAALYLHNTAALMVLSLNLVAALCWVGPSELRAGFAIRWIAANAVVAILFAFWLPVVALQARHGATIAWMPVPSLSDLRYGMMNVYAQPHIAGWQPLPDLLFLTAGLAGFVRFRANRFVVGVAIFVVLAVPTLSWIISQWRPIMNGKTLLWLTPVFLIIVAAGCTSVRSMAASVTAALVLVQAVACCSYFGARGDEGFPDVAAVLEAQVQPGDRIYLDTPAHEILLRYYGWPRARLRQVYALAGRDAWFRDFDGTLLPAPDFSGIDPGSRIWILTRQNAAEHRSIAASLEATMSETSDRVFGTGRVLNAPLRNLELSLHAPRPVDGVGSMESAAAPRVRRVRAAE